MDVPSFSVAEALRFLESGATILDVRELDEWRLGRIEGAILIPLGDLPDRIDELPEAPILCVCRSGSRSRIAAEYLIQTGRQAFNLDGGVLAWFLDGQPLVADHDHPSVG